MLIMATMKSVFKLKKQQAIFLWHSFLQELFQECDTRTETIQEFFSDLWFPHSEVTEALGEIIHLKTCKEEICKKYPKCDQRHRKRKELICDLCACILKRERNKSEEFWSDVSEYIKRR